MKDFEGHRWWREEGKKLFVETDKYADRLERNRYPGKALEPCDTMHLFTYISFRFTTKCGWAFTVNEENQEIALKEWDRWVKVDSL